ncbi:MAG: YqaA family protein [Methylococcales bacterium]
MLEINPSMGVGALFASAFISSTIAPGGSEAVLAYLVSQTDISPVRLLVIATIGNTLGALTTWFLGGLAAKGFSVGQLTSKKQKKSIEFLRRWGVTALMFSWLPVIGDGLCLAAGWLKLPFYQSLAAILFGKAARYCAVIFIFL